MVRLKLCFKEPTKLKIVTTILLAEHNVSVDKGIDWGFKECYFCLVFVLLSCASVY